MSWRKVGEKGESKAATELHLATGTCWEFFLSCIVVMSSLVGVFLTGLAYL